MIITLEERFNWKSPLVEVRIQMTIAPNGDVRELTTVDTCGECLVKFDGENFTALSKKIEETGREIARVVDIIRSNLDYQEG